MELFDRLLDGSGIGRFDLRPTGQPGSHRETLPIEQTDLGELINELLTFRPWSHQAHVATQDVPELWQLIEPKLADYTADAGHPCIALDSPNCLAGFLRISPHGTKLQDRKGLAVPSHALLPKEGRST